MSADFGRGIAADDLVGERHVGVGERGSSIDLAEDRVDRGDHGDAVGDEAAAHHVRQASAG